MRILLVMMLVPGGAAAGEPCRIRVVDKSNNWPVPLVELRTTGDSRFVTDNAGVIAFDLPEAMNRETWFTVVGHGYEVPKDGFGFRGVRLTPVPGKTLTVEVTRTAVAKRLGRLTGGGLFGESQKLGDELAWKESGVVGQDTVQTAVFGDKRFWLWGDTTLAHHPLGVFDATAATTPLKNFTAFEPPLRPAFDYFRDGNNRPRAVAKMPGPGPTWVFGLATVRDRGGTPRLVGSYVKIRGHLTEYECGLCVWNAGEMRFDKLRELWTKSDATPAPPPRLDGHAVRWTDPAGKDWLLFGDPFPRLQCPATFEAWQDPKTWKVLTPPAEISSRTGEKIIPHGGSIGWHAWRKKWVCVFVQKHGKPSPLGEVWFTEADSPFGPWSPAVKVLTHENYTFYNPCIHVDMAPDNSPILLFEGTYTAEFANHASPTPRHNYNQVLYRLDLDDAAFVR